jgi:hypothetical protein
MVWGASQFSLSAALREENFWSLGVFAEGAAETADELRGERLQDQAVLLLQKGDLGSFLDGILAAKLRRNDQLAFGGDGGDLCFHGNSQEYDLE